MPYQLMSSTSTVQVFSPTAVSDAVFCTILSGPSNSVLVRTITQTQFTADQGADLLIDLSNAVEGFILEGPASAATGTQGVDASGLLYDAVVFTVTYKPTYPTFGPITGDVEIPVNTVTAALEGGKLASASDVEAIIMTEYNRLKALAGE